jgi:hypothetical protein
MIGLSTLLKNKRTTGPLKDTGNRGLPGCVEKHNNGRVD